MAVALIIVAFVGVLAGWALLALLAVVALGNLYAALRLAVTALRTRHAPRHGARSRAHYRP